MKSSEDFPKKFWKWGHWFTLHSSSNIDNRIDRPQSSEQLWLCTATCKQQQVGRIHYGCRQQYVKLSQSAEQRGPKHSSSWMAYQPHVMSPRPCLELTSVLANTNITSNCTSHTEWPFSWYASTSPNINWLSQFFHCQNREEICNNNITKDTTTPQVCHYTTL